MQSGELGRVYHITTSRIDRVGALQIWAKGCVARGEAFVNETGVPADPNGRQDLIVFRNDTDRTLHILSILTRYRPSEGFPAGELIFDRVVDERLREAGFVRSTTGSHGEEKREFI